MVTEINFGLFGLFQSRKDLETFQVDYQLSLIFTISIKRSERSTPAPVLRQYWLHIFQIRIALWKREKFMTLNNKHRSLEIVKKFHVMLFPSHHIASHLAILWVAHKYSCNKNFGSSLATVIVIVTDTGTDIKKRYMCLIIFIWKEALRIMIHRPKPRYSNELYFHLNCSRISFSTSSSSSFNFSCRTICTKRWKLLESRSYQCRTHPPHFDFHFLAKTSKNV